MIEFRGITKRFDDGTVAVEALDLVASEGQSTVLVGPSGWQDHLAADGQPDVEPTSGTLRLDEHDIRSRPRACRRPAGAADGLGDAVAVLRTGGVLAQFAPPQQLLAEPADDFVAGFVGRDRGYRALAFVAADDLPVHELDTARVGEGGAGREWRLVVDTDGRPRGSTGGSAGSGPPPPTWPRTSSREFVTVL